mgnify:CR=1 FL=1
MGLVQINNYAITWPSLLTFYSTNRLHKTLYLFKWAQCVDVTQLVNGQLVFYITKKNSHSIWPHSHYFQVPTTCLIIIKAYFINSYWLFEHSPSMFSKNYYSFNGVEWAHSEFGLYKSQILEMVIFSFLVVFRVGKW